MWTAEGTLDDTVAVDDPRVARVAAERATFETSLHAVIEDTGLARADEAPFDDWEALHPLTEGDDGAVGAGGERGTGHGSMSAFEAVGKMPYDFSPARLRCMELADEMMAAHRPPSP